MKTILTLGFPKGFTASIRFVYCAIAFAITLSMLNPAMAGSSPEADLESVKGVISINGTVRINGQSAIAGQTLFANSNVVTFADSESRIALNNLAKLNLSPNTDLTVDSSKTTLSIFLKAGRVLGSVPAGVFIDFTTADLSIKNDAKEPVVFRIETAECGGTDISISAGHLETRQADQLLTVKAGETLSTTAGSAAIHPGQPALSRKRSIGLFVGIGAAVAVMLAVALGTNDEDQENPGDFGGSIMVPSPR